jgi:hypothetical protein
VARRLRRHAEEIDSLHRVGHFTVRVKTNW